MARHNQRKGGGASRSSGDYEVGYGKPPKAHQFQKGQTGNPRGRPGKKAEKAEPDFLDELIPITENGVQKKVTRKAAIEHAMFVQAMKGNTRAAQLLLEGRAKRCHMLDANAPDGAANDNRDAATEDAGIYARFLARNGLRDETGALDGEGGSDE